MKSDTTKIENELYVLFDDYFERVQTVAHTQFIRVVKPYLDKHGYSFISGNGTWLISKDNPKNRWGYDSIDRDTLPKRVLAVLETEIPGMDANDLGSIMSDYKGG